MNAAEFASSLNFAFQKARPTFFRGVYYKIELDGKEYELARTAGKGRNAGKWYLHVKKPVTVTLKSPDGTVLENYTEKVHRYIELHNAHAEWKE